MKINNIYIDNDYGIKFAREKGSKCPLFNKVVGVACRKPKWCKELKSFIPASNFMCCGVVTPEEAAQLKELITMAVQEHK